MPPEVQRLGIAGSGGGQQPKVIRQAQDRFRIGRAVGHDPVKARRSFEGVNSDEVLIRPGGNPGQTEISQIS